MPDSEPVGKADDHSTVDSDPAFPRGRRISIGPNHVKQSFGSTDPIDRRDETPSDDFGLPVTRRKAKDGERDSAEGTAVHRQRSISARSPVTAKETDSDDAGNEEENRRRHSQQTSRSRQESQGPHGSCENLGASPTSDAPNGPESTKSTPETDHGLSKRPRPSRQSTLNKNPNNAATILNAGDISEWSHQALVSREPEAQVAEEDEWQDMPAEGEYDLYDDDGKLVARGIRDAQHDGDVYEGIGGAGKGYTRLQVDDDANSATSMDENTNYLFKEKETGLMDDGEDTRDPLAQMQATKNLLTEGQRIAYVGLTRLAMAEMVQALEDIQASKTNSKGLAHAVESMKMWSQTMMVRLYRHMDIDSSEQIMIEQLTEHGVKSLDLTPALMKNARVKNPIMADDAEVSSSKLALSPNANGEGISSRASSRRPSISGSRRTSDCPPPPYELHQNEELPRVRDPSQLPNTTNIDIDLRWTVLCDLFLVLISDSLYDARSRVLLETVGRAMDVPWLDICRFEKRVTDALEMQEAAAQENWDESEHMEARRKKALKRKYMYMGLATVGGSLVIGLSAGLLAPVIGAGLAAGFTTIGVAGTGGFLAGAGGTAIITTGAVLSGGTIAVRASDRRTGAVKTFEYRPLHNNKRVNLIITISGWMTGKVDDVRLPFSTVDPIMGDVYSVLWEPDMLKSMGETIRILATEALTQGLQHVLATTILTTLMAALTLPIILTKLSYLIDNPWSVSLDRADAAGLILADSLIHKNLGARPITLIGFSLGSRVIFACLREMANKGAFGIVQNVYLFGSPIVAKKEEYIRARTVIAGRFVNGYARTDWILGYLFRATSGGILRIAGLAPVLDIPGLENVNVTEYVKGHMAYRAAMPRLLREVGWSVDSDEFTEIEDPDPDNHEARQRELIREIEDARKEAEAKSLRSRFGFFKRKSALEKKGWETYDDRMKEATPKGTGADDAEKEKGEGRVLFDIDAIRRELASEQWEVRQLESTLPPMKVGADGGAMEVKEIASTLPPMKLDLGRARSGIEPALPRPVPLLRASRSAEGSEALRHPSTALTERVPGVRLPNGHRSPSPRVEDSGGNGAGYLGSEGEGQGVTMSFEALPTMATAIPSAGLPSAVIAWRGLDRGLEDDSPVTVRRPELKAAATAPVAVRLEHNAWADEGGAGDWFEGGDGEEEELFGVEGRGRGREGEVKLSFE